MSWHFLQEGEAASWQESCLDGAPSALLKLMPELAKSCLTECVMESLSNSQSGMTFQRSTASRGPEPWMSSRVGSPVKTSANAGGGLDLMVQDQDFGWRWPESFVKLDQNSFLWKTRQCSLLGGLEEFSQTWPEWGLMQDGECFTRPPLEQRTTEHGFTWLLTPTAQSWKAWTFRNPLKLIRVNHADGNLQEQLMRLYQRMTTPRCQEILMMWPEGWTDSKPLAMDGFQQWLHEQCEF